MVFRKISKGILIVFILVSCSCNERVQKENYEVLISKINVIDVFRGTVIKEQNIALKEGKISIVTPEPIEANFDIEIKGEGKYIIPGLWDMHAHPDDPEVWRMNPKEEEKNSLLPLFVINGVTGIRDMGGDIDLVKRWRDKYENGELLAPKIFAGGPLLDGPNPMWDGSVGIEGPEQVPHVVDSLIAAGVDFLKVYSLLPRETYLEVSRYAKQLEFTFVGHVPFTVPPSEAAVTGMKSQEHLLEILKECSERPEQEFLDELAKIENPVDRSNKINDFRLKTFDSVKADSLYTIFEKHGIWHCPTLSMWHKNAWYEEEWEKDLALIQLLPPYLRAYWTPEHNDHLQYRDNQEFINTKQRLFRLYQQMIKNMNEKFVMLLAGTDMGANPLCHPGVGVHNELQAFVDAGLTSAEALRTATCNPALFFGIEQDYGSVSEGKIADLVLLNANPLDDIRNISKINVVVRDGKVFDSKAIDSIKTKIAKANRRTWQE